MQTTLILDKNTAIVAIPRHEAMPCKTKAAELLGRRFDECVAFESGKTMLHALLEGYRGMPSHELPIILSFKHKRPFCAYLSVKPIFSKQGAADNLECVMHC